MRCIQISKRSNFKLSAAVDTRCRDNFVSLAETLCNNAAGTAIDNLRYRPMEKQLWQLCIGSGVTVPESFAAILGHSRLLVS